MEIRAMILLINRIKHLKWTGNGRGGMTDSTLYPYKFNLIDSIQKTKLDVSLLVANSICIWNS